MRRDHGMVPSSKKEVLSLLTSLINNVFFKVTYKVSSLFMGLVSERCFAISVNHIFAQRSFWSQLKIFKRIYTQNDSKNVFSNIFAIFQNNFYNNKTHL